jgi:hypothetical protein
MKSTKYLPIIVFLMGFSMLVYSMYVFFGTEEVSVRPSISVKPARTAESEQEPPASAPSQTPAATPEPEVKRRPIPVPKSFQEQIDRRPEPTDTTMRDMQDAARKPAMEYLSRVGLQMHIPDDSNFYQTKSPSADIARERPGQPLRFRVQG